MATELSFGYARVSSNDEANRMLEAFFRLDGSTRIIEFETSSREAQHVFFDFKDKMKKVYEAEV